MTAPYAQRLASYLVSKPLQSTVQFNLRISTILDHNSMMKPLPAVRQPKNLNDAGAWDYVDRVVSPDGRVGDYDDWNPENEHFYREGDCPSHRLANEDGELFDAMHDAFMKAD